MAINIRYGTVEEKKKIISTYPHTSNVIHDGGYFIIAEINNDLIGYLWAFKIQIPAPVEQCELFINIIEVIYTDLRCKGIASKMIDKVIKIATKENAY